MARPAQGGVASPTSSELRRVGEEWLSKVTSLHKEAVRNPSRQKQYANRGCFYLIRLTPHEIKYNTINKIKLLRNFRIIS